MKKIFKISLLLLFLAASVLVYFYYPRLNILTGFAAKSMCSCVFEAEREPESVKEKDNDFDPVKYAQYEIDKKRKTAQASFLGLREREAVYKQGIGCTLLPPGVERQERTGKVPRRNRPINKQPFPYGNGSPEDTVFEEIDFAKLQTAVENAFAPDNRTRAVLVVYKDHLIAEHYSAGFSEDTKLLGWSMTKSITSAVLGILNKQGQISLEQDHLFPAWEQDKRAGITLNNLLHMNSGLEWEEDYTKISDVTRMLFLAENMGEVQLQKPLVGKPGNTWNYSSGTTNLLSNFIRMQFDTHQEYLDFWYEELIDKIGMYSMTLETDLNGNYVGSSYAWATARDWAKFGLLYLHRGNWKGTQILEESWVDYTTAPAAGSEGEYGAHFWLNAGGVYPNAPKDLYSANGFQGQYVFIIPSKNLVVVRFGLKEHPDFNLNVFLEEVTAAVE